MTGFSINFPKQFQNEYVTNKTCIGKTEMSTWQRESRAAEFGCENGEGKLCSSEVVYTVFFSYRF